MKSQNRLRAVYLLVGLVFLFVLLSAWYLAVPALLLAAWMAYAPNGVWPYDKD